jgi:putative endonuclease
VINRTIKKAPPGTFPFRGLNAGSKSRKTKGREGEETAARALQKEGMSVLFRNFRSSAGEIDLVVQDGESLVFVEVKNWPAFGLENLEYGINKKKKSRIIETAKYFLSIHREYIDRPIRFDVVYLGPREGACIRFEAAFMEIQ